MNASLDPQRPKSDLIMYPLTTGQPSVTNLNKSMLSTLKLKQ